MAHRQDSAHPTSSGPTGTGGHVLPEQLSAWIDGDLPASDLTLIASHLASCESCRAEKAALEALLSDFRQLPELSAPPAFVARVLERVEDAAPVGVFDRLLSWMGLGASTPLRRLVPLVAPLAVAVLAVVMVRRPESEDIRMPALEQHPAAPGLMPPPGAESAGVSLDSPAAPKEDSPAGALLSLPVLSAEVRAKSTLPADSETGGANSLEIEYPTEDSTSRRAKSLNAGQARKQAEDSALRDLSQSLGTRGSGGGAGLGNGIGEGLGKGGAGGASGYGGIGRGMDGSLLGVAGNAVLSASDSYEDVSESRAAPVPQREAAAKVVRTPQEEAVPAPAPLSAVAEAPATEGKNVGGTVSRAKPSASAPAAVSSGAVSSGAASSGAVSSGAASSVAASSAPVLSGDRAVERGRKESQGVPVVLPATKGATGGQAGSGFAAGPAPKASEVAALGASALKDAPMADKKARAGEGQVLAKTPQAAPLEPSAPAAGKSKVNDPAEADAKADKSGSVASRLDREAEVLDEAREEKAQAAKAEAPPALDERFRFARPDAIIVLELRSGVLAGLRASVAEVGGQLGPQLRRENGRGRLPLLLPPGAYPKLIEKLRARGALGATPPPERPRAERIWVELEPAL